MKAFFVALFVIIALMIHITWIVNSKLKDKLGKTMSILTGIAYFAVVSSAFASCGITFIISDISYGIFSALIDIMLYVFMIYLFEYVEYKPFNNAIKYIFRFIYAGDAISLLLNFVFHHAFKVEQVIYRNELYYSITEYYFPYNLHLGLCYVLCIIIILLLLQKIYFSPGIYKNKYLLILAPLIMVLAVDALSIFSHLPINYSVLAYGVMIVLVRFFTLVYAPSALINNTISMTVEKLNASIICFDYEGRFAYANSMTWKLLRHEQDKGFVENLFKQRRDEHNLFEKDADTWEESFQREGETEYLNIEYSKMYDSKHKFLGSYFHITDASERVKKAQQKIKKVEEENAAKSAFVSRLSHEIRTPLNSVYGMNELILRDTEDEKIKEYAEGIKNASDVVINIINDVLDYSRIEAGKLSLLCDNYSFSTLINDLQNMIGVSADEKNLKLIMDISENIPPTMFGDKARIEQILINLLSNAVKYTNEGSVTLKATGEIKEDDFMLTMSVTDTGIGIKEEDIPRLFVAYDRIEEVKHQSIRGTGLGLNIAIQLLKLMDSELIITSDYGKGSCFSFTIKQKIVNTVQDADNEDKPIIPDDIDYSDKSILVVDDMKINRRVLCKLMERTNANITEAEGGKEALELISNQHFDLIFLDHMMPEIDGIEVFNRMKSMKHANEGTPIIMLTANVTGDTKQEYLSMGFDGYLAKPVKMEILHETLYQYL